MFRSTALAFDEDHQAIRNLIDEWVLYRDAGDWERFRHVWHSDGVMEATWFQGTYEQFIEANREGWERGVVILHFLGGTALDIRGNRAVAQTKMTISQRATVHDVECDVVCTGRFYDLFEKRDERWGLVWRQPIYEKDRMDPVSPDAQLQLDAALLARFPVGYRHLAYLQTQIGYEVKTSMPGIRGPELAALLARGQSWLDSD
jgi:hypothetical protein